MKNFILTTALAVLVIIFGTNSDLLAQGKGKGKGMNGNKGCQSKFIDANGDGVCDNFVDANGDGVCDTKGTGKGKNFVDANGDGVNDNCIGQGKCRKGMKNGNGNAGTGANFIDADGDGVCDNFVDENGDGINDNRKGKGLGNGTCKQTEDNSGMDFKINNGLANGHSQVNFELKETGNVTLQLFDRNGNLVQEIYNGEMNKGAQSIEINTQDLTTGVYFYRLQIAGKTKTKQITIVK